MVTKTDLIHLANRARTELAACCVLANALANEAEHQEEYYLKEAYHQFDCAFDSLERAVENLHHA